MAYYGGPPGAYGGQQPPYGAPPGFGPPPALAAASPAGLQAHFQPPPPGMPANFNWTASTIRLGVDGPGGPDERRGGRDGGGRGSNAEPLGSRNRPGVGARDDRGGDRGGRDIERERAQVRENMAALLPATREEIARTIFVGGLGEGAPSDDDLEAILRCAGKLRRWTRARDADDRPCKFGFAEYEDVDSLDAANVIYDGGVEVPVFKNGAAVQDEHGEARTMQLLVVVDDESKKYIAEWKGRRKEDEGARDFRLDGCREDLRQCIAAMANARAFAANANANGADAGGDSGVVNGAGGHANGGADVVTIPVALEDELSDIPTDMRATVAAEIKAFRDRSTRRDVERLRREEEMEAAERNRGRLGAQRGTSPPHSGPNGAPLGPRGNQVQGAPAGPKGYRGAQLPSDYVNGVAFVGATGAPATREDDDAEESDEELERRRRERRNEELQRQYQDAERKWQNRSRARASAFQREREREEAERKKIDREKSLVERRLREWNDDEEARLGHEEYYADRSSWIRKRAIYREREEKDDERDRQAEAQEQAEERRREGEARGLADTFLDQTASALAAKQPAGFKISLGSAAAKSRAPAAHTPARRTAMGDVEGLLEDEEDAAANAGAKRPALRPLTETTTALMHQNQDLTDAERRDLRAQLAAEIPTNEADLFATPLKYAYLTDRILEDEIRPFVEKKVVEYLGVQEELLVDTVLQGLREKKEAREVVGELEPALEEEAGVLVRKVWRLGVFWGEAGARGLV